MVKTNQLIAGMLSKNFKESVKSFVANDDASSFMITIKGTPAYWKGFLFDVLAFFLLFFLRMAGISQTRTISHYNTAESHSCIMHYSPLLRHIPARAVCFRTLAEGVYRGDL